MPSWSDAFRAMLARRWGTPPDAAAIRTRYQWVEDLHARARDLLDPASLRTRRPEEVYAAIEALRAPHAEFRLTNLGRTNDARGVVESLAALMATPGDFAEKYRAAKIPQAGVVTLTTLLTAAKPGRFFLRNAAFTRGAAKAIPLYSRRALEELAYEDFRDLCRELSRVVEEILGGVGLKDWAETHRYLLLYAILTESA